MIDTIFVDLGDTFRVIRKDEAYSHAAKQRICELLHVDADPEAYYRDVIETRYSKYRDWALTFYCEAPVKVLWTRWLAYDLPRERVEASAVLALPGAKMRFQRNACTTSKSSPSSLRYGMSA